MGAAVELAVIIPTFNEAENSRIIIPQIHAALKTNYTVVIVDDNSPDGTQTVVQELAKTYPVKLISRPQKSGLASAVIEGMKSVAADAYIIMDADLSHPPEMLPELRGQIEIHDLAVASRYVKGGSISGWPLKRRIVSRVAIMLARPLTPVKNALSRPIGKALLKYRLPSPIEDMVRASSAAENCSLTSGIYSTYMHTHLVVWQNSVSAEQAAYHSIYPQPEIPGQNKGPSSLLTSWKRRLK
jgi:glycosyltransferase involved in cell wall biosynthesis